MALLAYLAVVIVTVAGLLTGLDWLVTPLDSASQMPPHVATAQASRGTPATPPRAQARADTTRTADADDSPQATKIPAQTAAAQCDVQACADAYQSFRASDCTYQPYNGPRKLCEKGDHGSGPATQLSALSPVLQQAGDARAEARCNVAACSGFYHSFRASDCTYQPFDGGPRRLCER